MTGVIYTHSHADHILGLDEIRAQPWRLLKQPDKDDLMREPIYAAARSYADAVSDLRAASEALEAALQQKDQPVSTE